MAQAPVMPIWTDALIGDTTHLSAEEFGAYCLILFATWRNNGKPLRNDDTILSRVCRVQKTYFKAKLKLVLLEFFDISDGYLHQKRLEKEWLRRQNFIASRRANGKRGGRPKHLNSHDTIKASAKASANLVGKLNESYPNPMKKEEDGYRLETLPESTESSKTASPSRYAFYGKVVRLTHSDYDPWRKRFHGIADFDARLSVADSYYAAEPDQEKVRRNWFIRLERALEKDHQKAVREKTERAERGGAFGAPGFA